MYIICSNIVTKKKKKQTNWTKITSYILWKQIILFKLKIILVADMFKFENINNTKYLKDSNLDNDDCTDQMEQ